MIIEITEFYILLPAWMTFIQGHSCMRNQYLCTHFLANFSINLGEILYAAIGSLFVEAHARFSSHNVYSRERIVLK